MKLPAHVEQIGKALAQGAIKDEVHQVAKKLIRNESDLIKMWCTLEREGFTVNDLWVWGFLRACHDASNLPRYHGMSQEYRRNLASQITKTAHKLNRLLTINGLDAQLFYATAEMFKGFNLYEDFGESNQNWIDENNVKKLPVSQVIAHIAERAVEKIAKEPKRGNAGRNARAVQFVRLMADRNRRLYRKPLLDVLAIACNHLFATTYIKADVSKLLSRISEQPSR